MDSLRTPSPVMTSPLSFNHHENTFCPIDTSNGSAVSVIPSNPFSAAFQEAVRGSCGFSTSDGNKLDETPSSSYASTNSDDADSLLKELFPELYGVDSVYHGQQPEGAEQGCGTGNHSGIGTDAIALISPPCEVADEDLDRAGGIARIMSGSIKRQRVEAKTKGKAAKKEPRSKQANTESEIMIQFEKESAIGSLAGKAELADHQKEEKRKRNASVRRCHSQKRQETIRDQDKLERLVQSYTGYLIAGHPALSELFMSKNLKEEIFYENICLKYYRKNAAKKKFEQKTFEKWFEYITTDERSCPRKKAETIEEKNERDMKSNIKSKQKERLKRKANEQLTEEQIIFLEKYYKANPQPDLLEAALAEIV